jgi:hypothetical protein
VKLKGLGLTQIHEKFDEAQNPEVRNGRKLEKVIIK